MNNPFLILWYMLADNVLGWEIVLKISSFPSNFTPRPNIHFSVNISAVDFTGRSKGFIYKTR